MPHGSAAPGFPPAAGPGYPPAAGSAPGKTEAFSSSSPAPILAGVCVILAAVGSLVLWVLNRVRVNSVLSAIVFLDYPVSIWIVSLIWVGVGVLIIVIARRHLVAVAATGLIATLLLSLLPTAKSTWEMLIRGAGVSVDTILITVLISLLLCGSMVPLMPMAGSIRRGASIKTLKTTAIVMLLSYLVIMIVRHLTYSAVFHYNLVQQSSVLPILIFTAGWLILAGGVSSAAKASPSSLLT